jgi:hypothetical protein
MGVSILRVKELLGHERIDTTMIYLHLINPAYVQAFSPFDKLYSFINKAYCIGFNIAGQPSWAAMWSVAVIADTNRSVTIPAATGTVPNAKTRTGKSGFVK